MKLFKILPNQTIKSSFNRIKKNGIKGLVVVNKNNKLLGTLTDGDLRNSLLKNFNLNNKVSNIYNKKPDYLIDGEYSNKDIDRLFYSKGLTFIPVVSKKNSKLINVFTLKKRKNIKKLKINKFSQNILCVIMAGGKGTRLKPFTDVLPKPLLPIQKQTVIEKIINSFYRHDLKKFIISVNYKSEILKAFFKELGPSYEVMFLEEKKPLGTVGSLSNLKNIKAKNIFVTNCDVITDVDFVKMYQFHQRNNFDITLLTSGASYQIPYGVCKISKDGKFEQIHEKPKLEFLTNVGVYIIKKNIIKLVPKRKKYDFTQLIKLAKSKNKKIGVFFTKDETWFDVGQWNELEKTLKKF